MKVLLLGDSTSFTGGLDPKAYPLVLAGKEVWPASSEMIGCLAVGAKWATVIGAHSRVTLRTSEPENVLVNMNHNLYILTKYLNINQSQNLPL